MWQTHRGADACVFAEPNTLILIKTHFATGWQRPIGCLIFIGHFPEKSPILSGSFAKHDLQLEASYESSPLAI